MAMLAASSDRELEICQRLVLYFKRKVKQKSAKLLAQVAGLKNPVRPLAALMGVSTCKWSWYTFL